MKLLEFTFANKKISLIAQNIQAVAEAEGSNGKANIYMVGSEEAFRVDETYREVQMMIINCDL